MKCIIQPSKPVFAVVSSSARQCMQGYSISRSEHAAPATVNHDWLADCHGLLRLRGFAVPHHQVPLHNAAWLIGLCALYTLP